jgi:hypothetical protein
MQLPIIDPASVYMTAGRDYNTATGYEFLIGAYEIEPTVISLSGEPFPVTLHRQGGFATASAAKRAGQRWAQANL